MKATEIRNVLSIYDDDMLNAACECEGKEALLDDIAKTICKTCNVGSLYNGNVFHFSAICNILSQFGFAYWFSDEDNEEHRFINRTNKAEISIYPTIFYLKQGYMKFDNINIF